MARTESEPLEILADLQHFKAATCLIDFIYSAQVALMQFYVKILAKNTIKETING